MKTIPVQQFCFHYNIPRSFIDSLTEMELVNVVEVDNDRHISVNDIAHIEKLMRLHYELNVNLEGLDIINNLIKQIQTLERELHRLRNKIEFYE